MDLKTLLKNLLLEQHKLNVATNGVAYISTGLCEDTQKHLSFREAVCDEVRELANSRPWKHWKHGELNLQNMSLEGIDLIHFINSLLLVEFEVNEDNLPDPRIDKILGYINNEASNGLTDGSMVSELHFVVSLGFDNVVKRLTKISTCIYCSDPTSEVIIEIVELYKLVLATILFIQLLGDGDNENIYTIGDNINYGKVWELYCMKNALNTLRSNYGYKTGEYKKMWDLSKIPTRINKFNVTKKSSSGSVLVEDNDAAAELVKTLDNITIDNVYKVLEVSYLEMCDEIERTKLGE